MVGNGHGVPLMVSPSGTGRPLGRPPLRFWVWFIVVPILVAAILILLGVGA